MTRLPTLLLLLLAAGCATAPRPYAPVRDVVYQARGAEPFWLLTIGDGRIVLRTAWQRDGSVWPRTLTRIEDGVRIWESGDPGNPIRILLPPGPCIAGNEAVYEDNVRIEALGRVLNGCGGRLLQRPAR